MCEEIIIHQQSFDLYYSNYLYFLKFILYLLILLILIDSKRNLKEPSYCQFLVREILFQQSITMSIIHLILTITKRGLESTWSLF